MKYLLFFICVIIIVYFLYFRKNNIESFKDVKSCHGWLCYNNGDYCPPGSPGSTSKSGQGYCCISNRWVKGLCQGNQKSVSMGKLGISPWGNAPGFLDQNAEWIWYTNGTKSVPANNKSSDYNWDNPPKNSGAVFYYDWINNTGKNINAKINVIIDNGVQIWVNSKYKGLQQSNWGSSGGIFNVTLIPGINNFQFRAQNYGNSPNPAGLLVTVVDENDQILFSSNNDWNYIQTNSNTYYTPISITPVCHTNYNQYCEGNGDIYLNSEKSKDLLKYNELNSEDCINYCINNEKCQMSYNDNGKCRNFEKVENVYMYCHPQNIPPAKNLGHYFLRNPQEINIGSSTENKKTITLSEENMIVSSIPTNPQSYQWPDTFKTHVKGKKLYVTRTDSNGGWSQNLSLYAYSTNNIVIKPQPSDSYIPISGKNIDYYKQNGSYGGTIPVTQADFTSSDINRLNKWINYENLPEDINYLGKKNNNDDTLSCQDNGYQIVNKLDEKRFENIGWDYSPFTCHNNVME